jgi:L-alanine-DL-glutamate epimerase-like enolase superfamily enzyme
VPDHTFVECFDEERDPFFWRLSDMSARVADGVYTLPERPGFGIELDLDYVAHHTVDQRATDRRSLS